MLSTYLPKSTSFIPAGTDLGVKLLSLCLAFFFPPVNATNSIDPSFGWSSNIFAALELFINSCIQSCNQYLSTCFYMMLRWYRYYDGKDLLDYLLEYLSEVSWSVDWYVIMCCHWNLQSHFGDQFWLVTLLVQIITQGTSQLDFHPINLQCYLLCLIPSQQYHDLYCYLEVMKSYSCMYICIYTIDYNKFT